MTASAGKVGASSNTRTNTHGSKPTPEEVRIVAERELRAARAKHAQMRARKIRQNVALAGQEGSDEEDNLPDDAAGREVVEGMSVALSALCAIPRIAKKTRLSSTSVPPPGLAWVRLKSNILVPQEYKHEFFVPYLGESEKNLESSNTLAMALFSDDDSVDGNDSEIEEDPQLPDELELADHINAKETRIRRELRSGPISSNAARKDRVKYSPALWDRAVKRLALKGIVDKLNCADVSSVASQIRDVFKIQSAKQVHQYYINIKTRENLWEVRDAEQRKERLQSNEVLSAARSEFRTPASRALKGNSISFFGCRQCYTYLCEMHGYPPDVPPPPPVVRPVDKTKKRLATSEVAESIEKLCENSKDGTCWMDKNSDKESAVSWVTGTLLPNKQAYADVKAVVSELVDTFGSQDSCRITALLKAVLYDVHAQQNFTCLRVGYLLEHEFVFKESGDASVDKMPRPRKRMGKASKKGKTRPRNLEGNGRHSGKRIDYVRCHHEGPCTQKTCSCVQRGELCEKFCGCNHAMAQTDRLHITCNNAFRGCSCKSSAACVTNACICFSQNRECDPDRCGNCHGWKGEAQGQGDSWSCKNDGLRMQGNHRVVAGHSEVHGWGAYAVDDIPKNDIVGEYVGEVITQEEAERRGRVYDEVCYSFLFNTTIEYALDSTRLGNKLRYCNHSLTPNCEPRVMKVGGDVRVGLYAKRNIGRNEELFFNYGYNDQGPAWAVSSKQSKRFTRDAKGRFGTASDFDSSNDLEIVSEIAREETVNLISSGRTGRRKKRAQSLQSSDEIDAEHEVEIRQEGKEVMVPAEGVVTKLKDRGLVAQEMPSEAPSLSRQGSVTPDRSVWRGVLRRVSAGAADVESPSRTALKGNAACSPVKLSGSRYAEILTPPKRRRPTSSFLDWNANRPAQTSRENLTRRLRGAAYGVGEEANRTSSEEVTLSDPEALQKQPTKRPNGVLTSPENGSDTERTESLDKDGANTLESEMRMIQERETADLRQAKSRDQKGASNKSGPNHLAAKNDMTLETTDSDTGAERYARLSKVNGKLTAATRKMITGGSASGDKTKRRRSLEVVTVIKDSDASLDNDVTSARKRLKVAGRFDRNAARPRHRSGVASPSRQQSLVDDYQEEAAALVSVGAGRKRSADGSVVHSARKHSARKERFVSSSKEPSRVTKQLTSVISEVVGSGIAGNESAPGSSSRDVVNLVSDDDDDPPSSGSYEPNFHKWFSKGRL